MAEVMNSLFGFTPESLQMQREKQSQQEALNFAQLQDPFARANYQLYQGAAGLGRQLGGLFGLEDPEMQRIQQRQGMLQNLDLSNPESLKQGIQQAMQNKDYQLVSELTNRYQQSAAAALKARETEANITAKTAEKKSFSVGDKAFLALAAKATPASVKAAQLADNDISLLEVPEAVKVSTYGQVLKDAGLKEGTPEFQKQMQAFAAAELEGTRKGKGTTVNLPTGEPEYLKEFGKGLGVKDLALKDVAEAAPAALDEVKLTRNLLDSGKVFTGTGAGLKLNVLALGQSLGVTGGNTDEIVANTQQLQQQRSKAVLNQIKTSGLGAGQGFTDKDLAFLQDAAAGRITLSAETLRRQLALEEKAFKASAKKWNDRVSKINPQFTAAMGLSPVQVDNAPPPATPAPSLTPTKRYNPATKQLEKL